MKQILIPKWNGSTLIEKSSTKIPACKKTDNFHPERHETEIGKVSNDFAIEKNFAYTEETKEELAFSFKLDGIATYGNGFGILFESGYKEFSTHQQIREYLKENNGRLSIWTCFICKNKDGSSSVVRINNANICKNFVYHHPFSDNDPKITLRGDYDFVVLQK